MTIDSLSASTWASGVCMGLAVAVVGDSKENRRRARRRRDIAGLESGATTHHGAPKRKKQAGTTIETAGAGRSLARREHVSLRGCFKTGTGPFDLLGFRGPVPVLKQPLNRKRASARLVG